MSGAKILSKCAALRRVNLVFMVTGFISVAVGGYVCSAFSRYDLVMSDSLAALPKFIIVTGISTLMFAVVGAFAARKRCPVLKHLYLGAMIVILIFQLSISVYGFVAQWYEIHFVWGQLRAGMSVYRHNPASVRVLDDIQRDFRCCGATNSYEWLKNLHTEITKGVPISCCDTYGVIYSTNCTTHNAFVSSCGHKLGNFIEDHMKVIAYSSMILAIIQGILVVLTTLAVRKPKQERLHDDKLYANLGNQTSNAI